MAVTPTVVNLGSRVRRHIVVFTANGNYDFQSFGALASMTFEVSGYTTGTFTFNGKNADSGTFAALPTATALAAAGVKALAAADLGFNWYRIAGTATAVATVTIIEKRID